MSRVVIVFTGGTIAMRHDPEQGGWVPALDGAELIRLTPGLGGIAAIDTVDWGLVPASHLSWDQILRLARTIERALARPDVDGVVVVQGTDTLEETAFAFDLVVRSEKPVIVVGAMRTPGEDDYDGPRNLRDAVRTAIEPRLRGWGTLVVMAGLVLPADDATKTHASALDSFRAPNHGPLGRIADGLVRLDAASRDRARLAGIPDTAGEPVALLTAAVATDGGLLRAALREGARGIVVEATGSGNTDPDLLAAAVEGMEQGVPVVLATRCLAGSVAPAYGFPGGGASWFRAGAIPAGTLSGPKARVALALGLGAGLDDEGLRRLFRAEP